MSVTIQDDMMAAVDVMSRKQGDALIAALVRYGISGEEPKGNPAWLPVYIAFKDRIRMSAEKMAKGKRMADARWSKHDAQATSKHDAQASDKHDAQASSKHDTEKEKENEKENEKELKESDAHASVINAQVAEVIRYLNEVCGTTYRANSDTSRKFIGGRLKEGFTVTDCKNVIDNMASAWLTNDEMRQFLRPTTLFRKEHFESYLNRPEKVSAYGNWNF